MHTTTHPLSPPSLEELVSILEPALQKNYTSSTISIVQCPDLRLPPFHLAALGLSGKESVADIGGQPNLFPTPRLDCKWSLPQLAQEMNLPSSGGQLLGAGAGPHRHIGMNCELAPSLSWKDDYSNLSNHSYYTKVESDKVSCRPSPSADTALMCNLYGSLGQTGPVLKITARSRKSNIASFTECIRQALPFSPQISLGGIFIIRSGAAKFHVMPDFPTQPFADGKAVNDWLTFHNFSAPVVCLSVLHSSDPENLDLRMEHTHCFSIDGANKGGHYHGDLPVGQGAEEEAEYEAYFNTAKVLYRIDKPEVIKERS